MIRPTLNLRPDHRLDGNDEVFILYKPIQDVKKIRIVMTTSRSYLDKSFDLAVSDDTSVYSHIIDVTHLMLTSDEMISYDINITRLYYTNANGGEEVWELSYLIEKDWNNCFYFAQTNSDGSALYYILSPRHFANIGKAVAATPNADFELLEDMDMSQYTKNDQTHFITPSACTTTFRGTFEGNNHCIKNLDLVIGTNKKNVGILFGTNRGMIRNFSLQGTLQVTGGCYVGGVTGQNFGTVENVSADLNDFFE